MSSILDALKKSEAERQRGLPPTLDSPAAFHRIRPTRRRSSRLWLPIAAVAAVVFAWASGLFDFGIGAPADEPSEAQVVDTTVENMPDAGASLPVPTAEVPAQAAAEQAQAPAVPGTDAVSPTPGNGTAPAENRPRRIGFGPAQPRMTPPSAESSPESTTSGTPATATTAAPSSPTGTTPSGDADAARAVAEATLPPPVAVPAQAVPAPSSATAPPATPQAVNASEPAAPAAGNGVPTIYELPFATRRALPAIAITMHMYSTDPERRFALVNGTRARGGESLEGGIDVVQVLPEGVQLRYEGTEFILPVGN